MGNSLQDPFILGEHEAGTLGQLASVAKRAYEVALMADGHPGIGMPIGCVAAYQNEVSVTGVGLDIGCGVWVAKSERKLSEFNAKKLEKSADKITRQVSFEGIREMDNIDTEIPFFEAPEWAAVPAEKAREWLKQGARDQLGTVGSGNHYIDVLVDGEDYLWVAVHFGSRGLGYHLARGVLNLHQGRHWEGQPRMEETILPLNTSLGQTYWELMNLAHKFALAGREAVGQLVLNLIDSGATEVMETTHNLAFKEKHDGQELIVVRKGATTAWPGQRGFVGSSMGEPGAIVSGNTSEDAGIKDFMKKTLYSTVHGSGRIMSRGQALGKRTRSGKILQQGQVTEKMMLGRLKEAGVIVRGGDVDESPHVYRRLPEVLAAQGPSVVVETWLKPVIVCMAGAGVVDPFKE